MGWLITVGILTMLAILPLGVHVRYNSEGPLVQIILGPIRLTLVPEKKKLPKEKKKKEPKKQTPNQDSPTPIRQVGANSPPAQPKPEKPKEKGGSLLDFLPLVKTVFQFLGDFRRKLRIDNLEVKVIMAGGDPADLALNYGRAWAALGNLLPKLENWFVIKKRDIEIECDFVESQTLVIARMELTITLGRLLAALVRFAFRALREYLKINKKRKGSAAT